MIDAFAGSQPLTSERFKSSSAATAASTAAPLVAARNAKAASAAREGEEAGFDISARWERARKRPAVLRSIQTWAFFFKFATAELKLRKRFAKLREEAGGDAKAAAEMAEKAGLNAERRELALFLKDGLVRLGPTFIKLGQVLSTRVDVLPKEYTEELAVLQDKVPGFDGEEALKIIEEELGKGRKELFDEFDLTPIASASLGQVHLATMGGKKVAVKVQRRGLRELFRVDLQNLKLLAVLLDKLDPKSDGADKNWLPVFDQSAKILYEEIDYELEGRSADIFRENFAGNKWVKVPKVYWSHTSKTVLTMEYVPGVKTNDAEGMKRMGVDPALVAQRSGESYLTQLLRHGFFHCDPHPGNVAVDSVAGGRLIYYDFGMMSTLSPKVNDGLVDFIFGLFNGSAKDICNAMEKIGIINPNADRISIEKIGRYFVASARGNMMKGGMKTKEEKKAAMAERLATIGEDLIAVGDDVPFNFPPEFSFVFRAFTTLEGVGKGLDPQFKIARIAGPYIKELVEKREGSLAITAVKGLQRQLGLRPKDINAAITQPKKIDYISSTIQKIEEGDLRIRVRVLDSERGFRRSEMVQAATAFGLVSGLFANAALVLTTAAMATPVAATGMCWAVAALCAVKAFGAALKVKSFDGKVKRYVRGRG
mmetsp:Transcript_16369/g.43887  ORF Transcript_16369/g.43887 Transcript_16369/m.43887 type:complete len:653 (-) Transcript_16369:77-2035(-)